MTQVVCDLRTIFDQPFTGRITFDPAQSGFGDCRLYLDIAQTYDLNDTAASINLVPSSRVGSYEVLVTEDGSDAVVFLGQSLSLTLERLVFPTLWALNRQRFRPGFRLSLRSMARVATLFCQRLEVLCGAPLLGL